MTQPAPDWHVRHDSAFRPSAVSASPGVAVAAAVAVTPLTVGDAAVAFACLAFFLLTDLDAPRVCGVWPGASPVPPAFGLGGDPAAAVGDGVSAALPCPVVGPPAGAGADGDGGLAVPLVVPLAALVVGAGSGASTTRSVG